MKNLIVITDYLDDPLAKEELRIALRSHLSSSLTPRSLDEVGSFVDTTTNTIHLSFVLKQILTTEGRLGDPNTAVIFVDSSTATNNTPFFILKHSNGTWICGRNAGFTFSLIQKDIEKMYRYQITEDHASSFKARDEYMSVVALLIEEKQDEMELEEIRNTEIPILTDFYVGHIDANGTIITTIPASFLKGKYEHGSKIPVTIGGVKHEVELIPSPSGKPDDPYLEIKDGKTIFPQSRPGDMIHLH